MLARQRHDLILDEVRRNGSARVRELAEQLDVSEMTVRRDLDSLADQRLIEKVHGGAIRVGDLSSFEPGFEAKQERQRVEKERIAEYQSEAAIHETKGWVPAARPAVDDGRHAEPR